uniref:Uncharacterized protein n=1 Tax=Leersia perrieri TaxID=77586 RepID=A0A0D9XRY2_9ORYZ
MHAHSRRAHPLPCLSQARRRLTTGATPWTGKTNPMMTTPSPNPNRARTSSGSTPSPALCRRHVTACRVPAAAPDHGHSDPRGMPIEGSGPAFGKEANPYRSGFGPPGATWHAPEEGTPGGLRRGHAPQKGSWPLGPTRRAPEEGRPGGLRGGRALQKGVRATRGHVACP